MFVFWSRLLVVSLAGTLALALPTIYPGDSVLANRQYFDPRGPVSISPDVPLVLD